MRPGQRVQLRFLSTPGELREGQVEEIASSRSEDVPRELTVAQQVFELAIYCDFAEAPNLEVRGNDDAFQHKLRSIEAYRSQLQIASLAESIRQDGPYEYLRDVHFRLYSSKKYRTLFAD